MLFFNWHFFLTLLMIIGYVGVVGSLGLLAFGEEG